MGQPTLKLFLLCLCVGAGAWLAFSRSDQSSIRKYTVARPLPRDRMLGAVIPRGERAWFFKLTGAREAVAGEVARFQDLIRSIRFTGEGDSAVPSWTLPDGWNERPGNSMRFATLEITSSDPPLECSVTVLPLTGDETAYIVANINRWRDQMKLPHIDKLGSSSHQLQLADASGTATWVDLAGELAAGGMGPGPGARPLASSAGVGPSAAGAAPALEYDVPAGWQAGALEVSRGGISVRRAAAFDVVEGDQKIEITVTSLPSSSLLPNINRWRSQIGLDALTPEQYEQTKKSIEFAGKPADYVQFFGPQEAILGVVADQGGMAWFAKLQGAAELAGRERERFETFIRSIRVKP